MKIAVQMYASVDGVVEAPETWEGPYWTDDHERYAYKRLLAADALLLGRATYQTFAASWPSRTGDDFADRMNSLPKYVASSTLDEHLAWNNSQVIRGDVVAEVTKLKQQPGRDILLYGSGQLFNTLLHHHLIDEFRLWVFPSCSAAANACSMTATSRAASSSPTPPRSPPGPLSCATSRPDSAGQQPRRQRFADPAADGVRVSSDTDLICFTRERVMNSAGAAERRDEPGRPV